jgi:hypothetical protein
VTVPGTTVFLELPQEAKKDVMPANPKPTEAVPMAVFLINFLLLLC